MSLTSMLRGNPVSASEAVKLFKNTIAANTGVVVSSLKLVSFSARDAIW
jgi:hypothetical protein